MGVRLCKLFCPMNLRWHNPTNAPPDLGTPCPGAATGQVIPQLYPADEDDQDPERALDRFIHGRWATILAERREAVDASPLARWIDEREAHPGRRRPLDRRCREAEEAMT